MVRFLQLSDGRYPGEELYIPPPLIERVRMTELEKQEAKRKYKQRYRLAYPEKYLAQKRMDSRNRRAAKRAAGGTVRLSEWRELLDKYDNKCLCCGTSEGLTLDHVLPIAQGGTNTIDNAQPLCALCNSKKGARHIDYR